MENGFVFAVIPGVPVYMAGPLRSVDVVRNAPSDSLAERQNKEANKKGLKVSCIFAVVPGVPVHVAGPRVPDEPAEGARLPRGGQERGAGSGQLRAPPRPQDPPSPLGPHHQTRADHGVRARLQGEGFWIFVFGLGREVVFWLMCATFLNP